MKIIKLIKCNDGKIRKFIKDTDEGYIYYSGYAKDFQDTTYINNFKSAQELIDESDYKIITS